jgi:predicted RNA-binding protein
LSKWLFVATPENWQRCLEKRTWGVKERYKTALQRIKTGDQILIHLTENKTAGICKVVREYFEDISIMWEGDEIYQHRIGIEPLKLPPYPIDAKNSYDKYLRAEHGSSRGYFGNAIRAIPDDEFLIV